MYKKKTLIIFAIGFVMLLSALIIYSNIGEEKINSVTEKQELKAIDVDYVAENPEKYTGVINVEGTVTEILDDKKFFTLGCEDACVNLPVFYKGNLPKVESNIIASGEVKKDVYGKYFFDAKEIKYK